MNNERVDPLIVVGLLFALFMGFQLLRDHNQNPTDQTGLGDGTQVLHAGLAGVRDIGISGSIRSSDLPEPEPSKAKPEKKKEVDNSDPAAIDWPYDHYTVTQGIHGASYGQMAIDIAAGKGAKIKSPITGTITEKYTDQWGNPTLVIENDVYQVTLLHGNYSVDVNDNVKIGQRIGSESNQGYTMDMQGNLCWMAGRDCGYHTHLNIYDKRKGSNVNPFDVLP
jgi:murein DD-endopeptidase MepM/ murein hydrolase activator NlpD